MKKIIFITSAAAAALFLFLGGQAFASEAGWRPLYDGIMKWVNFIILAAIIVKLLKKPLKEFLAGEKQKVEDEIHSLEDKKNKAVEKVAEAETLAEESEKRFEEIKERIVESGEKEKQRIIESANHESSIMLEDAKHKIQNRISQAQAHFRSELVDSAMDVALKKIKNEINEDDNQKFIDDYMKALDSK